MKRELRILLLLIFVFVNADLYSQEIVDLYKNLSVKLTDLNNQQKDSLLHNKKYIAPNSDSMATIVYEIDTIDTKNNYLSIFYNYTTGQAGWEKFEFRLFKSKSKNILIVSRIGGVRISHQQNYFNVYEVNKDNSIDSIKQNWTIDKLEFFESNTSKDFLTANEDQFCFNYEINPTEFPNGIAYTAAPCYTIDERIAEIQKINTIRINWNGQDFEKDNNR